ncbi:gliding motility-associated C-terminal domain-containing protein [Myroides odoratus]|uniref:gliding motility-associated C-terminal domain-containing protein n=1 Tax=Myroides odoratus TaxID=256 RepID=UPI0039AEBADE
MKKYVQVLVFFLVGVMPILGQAPYQNSFVNQGSLTISKDALVSTSYDFDNQVEGVVQSDGTTYYYGNFNNDNLYYPSANAKSGKAIFTLLEESQRVQHLTGSRPSEFYDVVLNNPTGVLAFDLQHELNVKGSLDFQDGIMEVDSLSGMLSFHTGAKALNPSDESHAQGYVEKLGKESFTYPIGDKGFYRYAGISAPANEKDAYQSKYILGDHQFFATHQKTSPELRLLNDLEYWKVEKSTSSKGDILLTLSWDSRTTLSSVLLDPETNLHIVRWDENQELWVDQGGVVAMDLREITTAVPITGYGYFTLATFDITAQEVGELKIYNLVTVNGDSKNDYFLIENITQYPSNTVEIYNRWGVKVYETRGYDSSGNVFRGYSEGRSTLKKGDPLPTGTYYYIVTYDKSDKNGSRTIKKSGYLHLETN